MDCGFFPAPLFFDADADEVEVRAYGFRGSGFRVEVREYGFWVAGFRIQVSE